MSEVVGVEKKKKKRIFYFDCLRALANHISNFISYCF